MGMVALGIMYSIHDFGGITTLTQVLEIGVISGFLIGTYLLARKNPKGWLWFILMNLNMGTLMAIQEKWIFTGLQIISLYFVSLGFLKTKHLYKKNVLLINK